MRPNPDKPCVAPTRSLLSHASWAAALLALTVALSSCGSPGGSQGDAAATSAAAGAGAGQTTAPTATTPSQELGETVTGDVMAGAVLAAMQDAGSFHVTRIVDQGDLKTGTEQDVKLTEGEVLTSSTTDMGGLTVDLIADSTTTYARSETLFQTPKWVEITSESPTPVIASLAEQLQQTQDTVAELSTTLSASRDYTATGTQTVDGADVTVYEGALPVEAALTQVPDELRTLAVETAGADHAFPVTLLVDSQGRLREMTQSFAVAGETATGTSTFGEYGKDFGLTMPQGDEIAAM